MLLTRAFLLPLLALFITAVLAAPIAPPSYSTNNLSTRNNHTAIEKRSPIIFSSDRASAITKRAMPEYGTLVARKESGMLDARSFDEAFTFTLFKRTMVRLVRRKNIFQKIRDGFKKMAQGIKKGFQKAGNAIKKGFQKAGNAIKKGVQKVAGKIKSGFQKAGKAIKKAAQKVGKFIKTTGARVAKFGLKIYATATKIASKIAGFIPGVGKVIGKALDGASRLANFVSDKIHVSLGKKLDKGMKILNIIQNPIRGAAGKILDKIFRRGLDKNGDL